MFALASSGNQTGISKRVLVFCIKDGLFRVWMVIHLGDCLMLLFVGKLIWQYWAWCQGDPSKYR